MSVKLLDTNTINKIAAGEVVERPASVVKELVENAIDAKATRVEVEILNGGKSFIKVTDNGIGMNREDTGLAIRSHATSKISSASDLINVSTLGFRGEALPTIASVSKFSLWTRQQGDELGTLLRLTGGKDQILESQGCALGTTILVEDLFFNVPARKKFLKQTSTEGNKISDYLSKLALSRPSIAFKLLSGNKMVLSTPGTGDLLECFESVYGHEMAESMLEIDYRDRADKNFTIGGFVSMPNVVKSYRSCQTFLVNGRVIGSRTISKAIDEAYRSLVPKGNYPLAVLVINVEPTTVDINVHPQKAEVRFEDDGLIYRAVYHAVVQALEKRNRAVQNDSERSEQSEPLKKIAAPAPIKISAEDISTEKFSVDDVEGSIENEEIISSAAPAPIVEEKSTVEEKPIIEEKPTVEEETPLFEEHSAPKKMIPIGQIALCYIVATSDDVLYLVDQHAAHERILFDRLSGCTDGIPAQQLLVPMSMEFDERETRVIEDNLVLFHQLGFTLERGDDGGYQLMEVPTDISDADTESILREILSSLPTVDDSFGDDAQQKQVISKNIREACLATTACRAAIKAGQELNIRQMQILLDELMKTQYPFTCPHGRPTIIKFDSDKLATMFKRKGF